MKYDKIKKKVNIIPACSFILFLFVVLRSMSTGLPAREETEFLSFTEYVQVLLLGFVLPFYLGWTSKK